MIWIWFIFTWLCCWCFFMAVFSYRADRTGRYGDYRGTQFWVVAFLIFLFASIALGMKVF